MTSGWVQVSAATVALIVGLSAPASSSHREIEDTYEVMALPYVARQDDGSLHCLGGMEGVNQDTHPLKVPFKGQLSITLNDFQGDWDLFVVDDNGSVLAESYEFNIGGPPTEEIVLSVTKRQPLAIVACNSIGGPTARVSFLLSHT